jgi:uncharacterized protein YPO0396
LIAAFGPAVANRVEDFETLAAECLAGELPPADRKTFVRQVADDWPAIGHWLQSRQFQVDSELKNLESQSRSAHQELQELREGHRTLPVALIRLQELLAAAGVTSTVFCEVIEIADPALQELIEAVLGHRRFDLLVPPEQFSAALEVFRGIEDPEFSAFGLVETPRLMQDNLSCCEGSLAAAVTTSHALARRYADAILGRGFAVPNISSESAQWLDANCWAVTEEGFLLEDFAVRRLPPAGDHQSWQIGGGGLSGRSEALQTKLKETQDRIRELSHLRSRVQTANELFDKGRRGPELLAEDYELPARLLEAQKQYQEACQEAEALKQSDLGQLRELVEQAEQAEQQSANDLKHAWGRQCVAEQSLNSSEVSLSAAEKKLAEMLFAYETRWPVDGELTRPSDDVIASKSDGQTWEELIAGWTEQLRSLQKSFGERHDDGVRLRTEYNNRFQFSGDCLSEEITEYIAERARWVESELPSYGDRLEAAKETARQVLEEEVIHRLRERLCQVDRHFQDLNKALEGLNFSGRQYRFTHNVRKEFQPFYDMVAAAEAIADEPLHQSEWHKRFGEGPLKELLDDVLSAGGNRALTQLEHCTDYRAYFEYDIEITEADGTVHAFSHVAGSGSGGETQTPYYVAMLASLARVYRTRSGQGSRAALVAFDEPFQKMDESNIAATLQLAHRLGLQVLLAAPKDRCHQLLPGMGTATCLLVIRDGHRVLLEPFQRMADDRSPGESPPLEANSGLILPSAPKSQ